MTIADSIGGTAAPSYSLLLEGPESTVCAQAPAAPTESEAFQTERELENELVDLLVRQGYAHASISTEDDLLTNLRLQIETLNGFEFTDEDWERFHREVVANRTEGVVEKTSRIQQNPVVDFTLADGTLRNVALIDRDHIHRNRLQVMSQYVAADGTRPNRYDVTILVNGLPLVHIELKRRGVALREAFDQIERYKTESFWSGSGLFEFIQIFVISNGTETRYYSNTVREQAKGRGSKRSTDGGWAFTSRWADAAGEPICDLIPFASTFLAKGTLLMILTRYCVFDTKNELLVMRPYQICACERVLNRILVSELDARKLGSTDAGGFIWHTTGSGKTLTSFKVAQLAGEIEGVEKVLFVVDRKDLDYQTMKEYERFQKGAVNGSKDTRMLARNLESDNSDKRICVTTIQKLANYIRSGKAPADVLRRHTVLIFDECHRSQFGKMHETISRAFKNYHLFGFTGTPIFTENSIAANSRLQTTEQAFGDCLHTYTVVDAIRDQNVLPFLIDYVNSFHIKGTESSRGEMVEAIDTDSAWRNPKRIEGISRYILDHFNQKTRRTSSGVAFSVSGTPRVGFNSILAVDSIASAKEYYKAMKRLLSVREEQKLNVAVIFTATPNGGAEETADGILADEPLETTSMTTTDLEFLSGAIDDYNKMFGTSYDAKTNFDGYYKDVSRRMKGEDEDGKPLRTEDCLDLLIVVNMFLTGFDAKTMNTLWVDKNLKMHGLMQAFSRTNRIFDSVKAYGNIVCFRNLRGRVDEALALFGEARNGKQVSVLRPYSEYLSDYKLTAEHIDGLGDAATVLNSENSVKRDFVGSFSCLLRLRNILESFDQFKADDPVAPRKMQDYKSTYLTIRDEFVSRERAGKSGLGDDLEFEIELVRRDTVDIDYILKLIEENCYDPEKNRELAARIASEVRASPELRDKQDLIEEFLDRVGFHESDKKPVPDEGSSKASQKDSVVTSFRSFIAERMESELSAIIEAERLKPEETRKLMSEAFETGGVQQDGTAVAGILPPQSRFGGEAGTREAQRVRVAGRLSAFHERFRMLTKTYPMS